MKLLERFLNVSLALLVLLVASGVALAWSRFDTLYQVAIGRVEAGIHQATGLDVKVGSVGGFWWHSLAASDIRVYASSAPGAPLLAYIPEARAEYSLLDVLRMTGRPIRVDVEDPFIRLRRDAAGRLDLKLPEQKGPRGAPPDLVAVRLVVHHGAK